MCQEGAAEEVVTRERQRGWMDQRRRQRVPGENESWEKIGENPGAELKGWPKEANLIGSVGRGSRQRSCPRKGVLESRTQIPSGTASKRDRTGMPERWAGAPTTTTCLR